MVISLTRRPVVQNAIFACQERIPKNIKARQRPRRIYRFVFPFVAAITLEQIKVVLRWSICNADSQRMFFARICRHATLVASFLITFKNLQRVAAPQIPQKIVCNGVLHKNDFSRNIVSLQIVVAHRPV